MDFADFINIAQILLATLLVIVLLMQAKGAGISSTLGGGASSSFRTRRGIEKSLFNLTIVLAAAFLIVSIIAVRAAL